MISLRKKLKSKWITLFSVAVVIAVMTLAFPLNIAPVYEGYSNDGSVITITKGENRIVIGNTVGADTADYTCDGTDDDVQFQAAFDALPASGGQVWVESGTYNWDTTTTVTRAIDNISVIGVGGGVDINTDDVTAAFSAGGNYWLFSNMQWDAGGVDMGATTDWMWLNVDDNGTYYSVRTDSINIEDHSALHETGGADAIKIDDLASADDNTDLNTSLTEHGLMPKLGGGTTNFFRADGAWADPGSGGDVSGPGSSTDNMIARHDGAGGKTLQDYTSNPPTISDSGDMNVDGDIDVDNVVVSGDVDGRDVSVDGAKLDGVEALADVTDATNVAAAGALMDSGTDNVNDLHIDWGAGANQVDADDIAESGTRYWAGESGADVTDAANVASAGALMDSGTDNIDDTHINWGAGAGQVDADDMPESGTRYWAGESGADVTDAANVASAGALMDSGTDNIDDTHINWGAGAGQVDADDVPESGTNFWASEDGADVTADNAPQAHTSSHAVSGSDTVFPADPNADRYLMWDDAPTGELIWTTANGGDVTGPGSSVDNAIVRFDSTSGKIIQDYTSNAPTISDTGDMNIDGDIDCDNIVVSGTVDGVDVSTHSTATTGVHGVGAETILHTGNIGSSVQAWDTELDDIAALTDSDGNFIVGDGGNWVAESGSTARDSLSLGTGDTPQFTGIETGHASDTSITRASAGDLNVEGNIVYRAGGTDVPLTDGGTGSSTAAGALANLSGTASATFDWNGQTLADWGIESGATVDASPTTGQFFLHTPTGRTVLLQYDGSNWNPIQSFGTMTMYVDGGGTGTDAIDYGWGTTTNAFNTVQYAVDQIPPDYGGDIVININAETYAETVTIQGKVPIGDYTITLQGTLASQETGTATGMTAGSGAEFGILTDSGNPFNGDDYADMLLYVATLAEYRIIDGHCWTLGFDSGSDEPVAGDIITGQTSGAWATVVAVSLDGGTWGGANADGTFTLHVTSGTFQNNELLDNETQSEVNFATVDTPAGNAQDDNQLIIVGYFSGAGAYAWTVYDWGTEITQLVVEAAQVGVAVNDIYFSTGVYLYANSSTTLTRVEASATSGYIVFAEFGASATLYYCSLTSSSNINNLYTNAGSNILLYSIKVGNSHTTGRLGYANRDAFWGTYAVCVFDGYVDGTNKALYGIYTAGNSCITLGAMYNKVRNCDTGTWAEYGGQVIYAGNTRYSDCTTDETATAASFGYIG